MTNSRFLTALVSLSLSAAAIGAPVDFVRDIRPIFQRHCYDCHGAEKQKSGLRLDLKPEALKGGSYHAPNIIAGRAEDSPLMHFVTGQDEEMLMPPKGERLTKEEINLLASWIDQGAPWPEGVDAAKVVDKRDHWAFKPLGQPPVPPAPEGGRGPLDAFVAAKLAEKGLQLSPEADRRTLIRRLHLVLHGLLPAPEEVEAFARDQDPRAYEKLVDHLLESPRYGERWARHWLDVIAFGETHGFEVNTPRENAWPYRDYVIRAFNEDRPYPRFIMEQLAGDTLGEDAATGFMVASAALLSGQIGKDEESKLKARQDELNDMVATTGGAFLGLTLHCARCHDHKFDPVAQEDYYSLQAVFAGVRHGERPLMQPGQRSQERERKELLPRLAAATHRLVRFDALAATGAAASASPRRVAVHARRNAEHFLPVATRKVRFTVLATSENNRHEPCLDELEVFSTDGRNVALAAGGAKARSSGSQNSGKHRLEHVNDGFYGNERSWISTGKGTGQVEIEFPRTEEIEAVVWGRDRLEKFRDRLPVEYRIEVANPDGSWQEVAGSGDRESYVNEKVPPRTPEPAGITPAQLAAWHTARGEVADLEKRLGSYTRAPMVYAGRFEEPGLTRVLYRGEAMQPRQEVTPGAVTALGPAWRLPAGTPERERRVALARWLGDPANPLPARVLVNRLWQHHFGAGIVATPSDFGRNGARPSHPELLDWLAGEFIRSGWSIKAMQRLVVMSAAWRQSSAPHPAGLAKDAASQLLWRFPPRRLEAEALRDNILAAAGTLDLRMGGPGFSVFAPNYNYVRVYDPKTDFGPPDWRRMIYVTKVRMAQDATFGSFDCPDAGQPQPLRPRSTTPLQALSLFNSGFVNQQAALFAGRLVREAGEDPARQVTRAFALSLQREPAPGELAVCETLIREHGLPALCRVLFNANEFLFVP